MNDKNVATIRTTWNTSLLTAITVVLYKVFGWEVTVDDLIPYLPIIIPVVGAFYRFCRLVGDKYPWVGRILFGMPAAPTYAKPE